MGLPRWACVVLLFLINLINYMDRWTVAGVLPELQAPLEAGGFAISDGQGGLLTSVFVLAYMALSPIFGYASDRVPRKRIIVIGVGLFCIATMLSSFSRNYSDLLLCRALVGVGEASYATVAPTLIADLYPQDVRTKWLSLYFVAVPLGSALGFIVGGTTSVFLGWRWAFRYTPVTGLFLTAVLHVYMDEPVRGAIDGSDYSSLPADNAASNRSDVVQGEEYEGSSPLVPPPQKHHPMGDFLSDARKVWATKSFMWSTLGLTSGTFVIGALGQWTPTLLQRVNCNRSTIGTLATDEDVTDCKFHINLVFGIISCITGIAGTLLGAVLSTIYSQSDNAADAALCCIGLVLTAPAIFMALQLAPISVNAAWLMIFIGEMAVSITWAPVTALLLYVIPPRRRGMASGMQTLFSHLFGDASSPVLVGLIADYLHNEYGLSRSAGLQKALYPSAGWAVLGAVFFFIATFYVAEDRAALMPTAVSRTAMDKNNAPELQAVEPENDEAWDVDGVTRRLTSPVSSLPTTS